MGRKVPFWRFPIKPSSLLPKIRRKIRRKIARQVQYKAKKRKQVQPRPVNRPMKGILKKGVCPKTPGDKALPHRPLTVRFGAVRYHYNTKNPNRLNYLLALRKRNARRNALQLVINKVLRRAERAACVENGLHCDQSGNSYPFMTNMRTFINSAQNAVLMKGWTAARKVIFKAKNITIKPRSGLRRLLRLRAATI